MTEREEWLSCDTDTKRELLMGALQAISGEIELKGFLGRGACAGALPLLAIDGDDFIALPPESGATLGCEREASILPPELVEVYEAFGYSAAELSEMLAEHLEPTRTVAMPWLLVERSATLAWRLDRGALPNRAVRTRVNGDVRIHYFGDDHAALQVEEPRLTPHAAQAQLGSPWRLPTSDEWEYVCRAEVRSIFWWGDSWPPLEATPEAPEEFLLHLAPNAWGFELPRDAYQWEFTSTGVMCGGDGGTGACGGEGPLGYWLPLSPSFRFALNSFPRGVFGGRVRRILTLEL